MEYICLECSILTELDENCQNCCAEFIGHKWDDKHGICEYCGADDKYNYMNEDSEDR